MHNTRIIELKFYRFFQRKKIEEETYGIIFSNLCK